MKLIDLLVKKTKQEGWAWPGKSTFCYQTRPEHGYMTKFFDRNGVKVVDYRWEKCDDASAFNELTKEQYESALAASEGWIECGGGECPVHESANVDIKLEDGSEKSDVPASAFIWQHDDDVTNIIAYRLHKPEINSRANDDRLEQDLNECIGQDVDMPEWNGDGLPPDGVECEVRYVFAASNWMPFRCVKSDAGVAFGWSGGDPVTAPIGKYEFRPLPGHREATRDAACDKICDAIRDAKRKTNIILTAESIYDAIAAGKIPGVKLEGK